MVFSCSKEPLQPVTEFGLGYDGVFGVASVGQEHGPGLAGLLTRNLVPGFHHPFLTRLDTIRVLQTRVLALISAVSVVPLCSGSPY